MGNDTGLSNVVVGKPAAEAATGSRNVHPDIFTFDPGCRIGSTRGAGRHLGGRDHVDAVAFDPGIAILRFQRCVGDERHLVSVLHHLVRCSDCSREIALVMHQLALAGKHLGILLPELLAAVVFVRTLVPLDLERPAALDGGPRRVRHHGHAVGQYVVGRTGLRALDRKHVQHALDGSGPSVVDAFDGAVEHR